MLALLAALALVPTLALAQSRPTLCTWIEKEPITDPTDPPNCVISKCMTFCKLYPGEYMCTGKVLYTDTDDERVDMNSPAL